MLESEKDRNETELWAGIGLSSGVRCSLDQICHPDELGAGDGRDGDRGQQKQPKIKGLGTIHKALLIPEQANSHMSRI
jgi:hypothetical protein